MPSNKKLLQAAAGNAGGDNLYVEDVFSTYLYTGTGSSLPIVNGIDLADSGGLVWTKRRTSANSNWFLDSERGGTQIIRSNTTEGQFTSAGLEITSFNSDGYTLGTASDINSSSQDDVSWTFRKAEKFFDIQTWTGNATAGRQIPHSLGSTPAFIITKRTDSADNWKCYHVGNPSPAEDYVIELDSNSTAGNEGIWNDTAPTATNFTVSAGGAINASGGTYVAYLFASDAGGYGDDGDENIIKCGTYTGTNSNVEVNCGFEAQWVLVKNNSVSSNWVLIDTMRGAPLSGYGPYLSPNQTNAESSLTAPFLVPTATGFFVGPGLGYAVNYNGHNYIYVAIRRPMKTPESGTEVFAPKARSGSGAIVTTGTGFTPDVFYNFDRTYGGSNGLFDRLRGRGILQTLSTAAENTTSPAIYDLVGFDTMDGVELGEAYNINMSSSGRNFVDYYFKRATGFMDMAAYTGNYAGNPQMIHNLGVAPEMLITKATESTSQWYIKHTGMAATDVVYFNSNAKSAESSWTSTSSYWQYGSAQYPSNEIHVVYLFATLAGISKVGSYTGTGNNLNVDCGFSAGARWIMIKRTDATGDWYIWDSARGIVSGNDPYMLANSSASEVTNTDYIDPLSSGFTVTSSAPAALNASGGNYIFLAIA